MLLNEIFNTNNFFYKFIETELTKYNIKEISFSHYQIIRLLITHKSLQPKIISSLILKHKSTVTSLIEKLKKLEYVEITKSKKDKRSTFVSLTPKGLKLKGIVNSIEQKIELILQKSLTPKENNDTQNNLKKIVSV